MDEPVSGPPIEYPRCSIAGCTKGVQIYSGLTERGYCSEECYEKDPENLVYRTA